MNVTGAAIVHGVKVLIQIGGEARFVNARRLLAGIVERVDSRMRRRERRRDRPESDEYQADQTAEPDARP
jgi:hypothetical protein